MRITLGFICLTAALYHLDAAAHGLASGLEKRNVATSDIGNSQRGAVLILGRLQTSCEVALLDSQNGIVAASCFIYLPDGNVDDNQDYKIGINDPVSLTNYIYTIGRIDAHPEYDASTYVNNIAVIGFNINEQQSWNSSTAGHRAEWSSVYYTSRSMESVSKNIWSDSEVVELGIDSGCGSANNLYSSNSDWMMCISHTHASSENGNCVVPYGAAWAIYQPDNMAVAAVYSHSAITSDSLCQATGNQYHYYTMLEPYMPWIQDISGTILPTFWLDSTYSYSGSSLFGMVNSAGNSSSEFKTVAGDFYPMQRAYALDDKSGLDASSFNDDNTESSTGITDSNTSETEKNNGNEGSTGDGLSRSDIIAVAVVAPIATIVVITGLYFLYKWWHRHQNSVRWDPKGERANFYRMEFADDISAADISNYNADIESEQIGLPPVVAHSGLQHPPPPNSFPLRNTGWTVTTTHTYWESNRATRPPTYSPWENANARLPPEKTVFN